MVKISPDSSDIGNLLGVRVSGAYFGLKHLTPLRLRVLI